MKIVRLSNLLRRQDGATAVEFALISPVLMLFIVGILELSMMLLAENMLESATFSASRTGKTGFEQEGQTREDTIMQALNDRIDAFLDPTRVTVTQQAYNEFGDIGSPEPFVDANSNGVRDIGENYIDVNLNGRWDADMGVVGAGEAGDIVVFTVSYPWNIVTPLMRQMMGTNGVINLTARTVVRNEPF